MKKIALLALLAVVVPLVAMSTDDERQQLINQYKNTARELISRRIPEAPEEVITRLTEFTVSRENLDSLPLEQLRERVKQYRSSITDPREAARGSLTRL